MDFDIQGEEKKKLVAVDEMQVVNDEMQAESDEMEVADGYM